MTVFVPLFSGGAVAPQKLNEQEIAAELAKLPGWSLQGGKLHREFVCRDFVHAFGFMTSVALAAEAMNHHPDWSNAWNKVVVDLVTHSVGAISNLDVELARMMETLAHGTANH